MAKPPPFVHCDQPGKLTFENGGLRVCRGSGDDTGLDPRASTDWCLPLGPAEISVELESIGSWIAVGAMPKANLGQELKKVAGKHNGDCALGCVSGAVLTTKGGSTNREEIFSKMKTGDKVTMQWKPSSRSIVFGVNGEMSKYEAQLPAAGDYVVTVGMGKGAKVSMASVSTSGGTKARWAVKEQEECLTLEEDGMVCKRPSGGQDPRVSTNWELPPKGKATITVEVVQPGSWACVGVMPKKSQDSMIKKVVGRHDGEVAVGCVSGKISVTLGSDTNNQEGVFSKLAAGESVTIHWDASDRSIGFSTNGGEQKGRSVVVPHAGPYVVAAGLGVGASVRLKDIQSSEDGIAVASVSPAAFSAAGGSWSKLEQERSLEISGDGRIVSRPDSAPGKDPRAYSDIKLPNDEVKSVTMVLKEPGSWSAFGIAPTSSMGQLVEKVVGKGSGEVALGGVSGNILYNLDGSQTTTDGCARRVKKDEKVTVQWDGPQQAVGFFVNGEPAGRPVKVQRAAYSICVGLGKKAAIEIEGTGPLVVGGKAVEIERFEQLLDLTPTKEPCWTYPEQTDACELKSDGRFVKRLGSKGQDPRVSTTWLLPSNRSIAVAVRVKALGSWCSVGVMPYDNLQNRSRKPLGKAVGDVALFLKDGRITYTIAGAEHTADGCKAKTGDEVVLQWDHNEREIRFDANGEHSEAIQLLDGTEYVVSCGLGDNTELEMLGLRDFATLKKPQPAAETRKPSASPSRNNEEKKKEEPPPPPTETVASSSGPPAAEAKPGPPTSSSGPPVVTMRDWFNTIDPDGRYSSYHQKFEANFSNMDELIAAAQDQDLGVGMILEECGVSAMGHKAKLKRAIEEAVASHNRATAPVPVDDGSRHRMEQAFAFAQDTDKVMQFFAATAGRMYKATRAVVLSNPRLTRMASDQLMTYESRRGKKGVFELKLPDHLADADRRSKKALTDFLKSKFKTTELAGPGLQYGNVLPVWHGANERAVHGIADVGFAALADPSGDDPGYFANGRYNSTEAEYAALYATDYPTDKKPNENGEWCVLLSAAVVGVAYAVTPGKYDFPDAAQLPSEDPSECRLFGRGFVAPCDTHIVGVKAPDFLCCNHEEADFHEVVSSQDSQLLPLAIVFFKKQR